MTARLPTVGGDGGNWGNVLNEFLEVGHRSDGTLKGVVDVINVKDFGAVGDGVTDDTAAIQSALDAVPLSGGTLYIPSGTYAFTGLTITKSYLTICGAGRDDDNIAQRGTTSLKYTGSDVAIAIAGTETISNLIFRDFDLQCDSTAAANATAGLQFLPGISGVATCNRSQFERVSIRGFTKNDAIGIDHQGGVSNTFTDCYIHDNYIGFSISRWSTTVLKLVRCLVRGNNSYGVQILDGNSEGSGPQNTVIEGGVIESNGGPGVYVNMATGRSTRFTIPDT